MNRSSTVLYRPFRFYYTKDAPGLVAINASSHLGLAFLRMGIFLRENVNTSFPMPLFDLPLLNLATGTYTTAQKDLYYIGYWTMYSSYYNLYHKNYSYDDIDALEYASSAYDHHLPTFVAPDLAEAGVLLNHSSYILTAVAAVMANGDHTRATTGTAACSGSNYPCKDFYGNVAEQYNIDSDNTGNTGRIMSYCGMYAPPVTDSSFPQKCAMSLSYTLNSGSPLVEIKPAYFVALFRGLGSQ